MAIRLISRIGRIADTPPSKEVALAVRLGAFALTATVLSLGHVRESSCHECPVQYRGLVANRPFYTLLAIDLLPAVIYVLGARRWKTVVLWGAALMILSALPWLLSYLHEIYMAIAFIGYPVLLIGCSVAVIKDLKAW